jgi:hypothetical protein
MGSIISICGKSDREIQIEKLQSKLAKQKKLTSAALEELSHQKLIIFNHEIQSRQYDEDFKQYEENIIQYEENIKQYVVKATKLIKYEAIIKNSELLASHILTTDLNCKWMDNDKEKEYLKSIFDYISTAMSDPSFQLRRDQKNKNLKTNTLDEVDSDATEVDEDEVDSDEVDSDKVDEVDSDKVDEVDSDTDLNSTVELLSVIKSEYKYII